MKITKEERAILIVGDDFDIESTLQCGQIFSFQKDECGRYIVTSANKLARITYGEGETRIETEDVDYFYNFFDLDTDYVSIKEQLCKIYPQFDRFLSCGRDIRILRQDRVQTILSFIVSANNNIKRIKKILFSLSQKYGEEIEKGVFSFPTLDSLSSATEADFVSLGMGYRAPYMVDTIAHLRSIDMDYLSSLPTMELRKALLTLKGVGPKVADCVLFFGFARTDVFPVDTWIRKSYSLFCEDKPSDKEIGAYFVSLFGKYSGYAQQYIFNYMINTY